MSTLKLSECPKFLEALKKQCLIIEEEINRIHGCDGTGKRSRRWSSLAGQWLVYGFEQRIGFANACALEAAIEANWRAKAPVGTVAECAERFFIETRRAIEARREEKSA